MAKVIWRRPHRIGGENLDSSLRCSLLPPQTEFQFFQPFCTAKPRDWQKYWRPRYGNRVAYSPHLMRSTQPYYTATAKPLETKHKHDIASVVIAVNVRKSFTNVFERLSVIIKQNSQIKIKHRETVQGQKTTWSSLNVVRQELRNQKPKVELLQFIENFCT